MFATGKPGSPSVVPGPIAVGGPVDGSDVEVEDPQDTTSVDVTAAAKGFGLPVALAIKAPSPQQIAVQKAMNQLQQLADQFDKGMLALSAQISGDTGVSSADKGLGEDPS